MQSIRAFGTQPELLVRRLICDLGFRSRYRLHDHKLPGRPDLVFPTIHKIVFVHGCFWHSHASCKIAHAPASRLEYWEPKLRRNAERDGKHLLELRGAGWKVLVIWECQLRQSTEKVKSRLANFLAE